MTNLQNQYLEFSGEQIQVTEELDVEKNKWLKINGVALVAGKSRNKRIWTDENLKENDGKEFKYIVNHPKQGENMKSEQVVGKGTLRYVDGVLRHEGRIRDTTAHPDIMSRVADGLLDPSIGATFASMDIAQEENEKVFKLSGTEINHVAFIAYPGIKAATIEVAAEESFNAHIDLTEENDTDIKNNGDKVMEEEKNYKKLYEELVVDKANKVIEELTKRVQVLEEAPAEESKPEEKAEEPKVEEKPEEEAKESGVGQIVTEEAEKKPLVKEDSEGITMATEAYEQFNKEIRENVGEPLN